MATEDDEFLSVDSWPSEVFAPHYHHEFNWIVPMRPGRVVIRVEDREHTVDGNHWLCVFPWTEHTVVHVSDSNEVLSLFIGEVAMARAYALLSPPPPLGERCILGGAGSIAQGLALAWGNVRFSSQPVDDIDRALELFVAGWIWRAYRPGIDAAEDWSLRLRTRLGDQGAVAVEAFERHLAEVPFPWTAFAKRLGLSRRTLQRHFIAKVGAAPTAVLSGLRLERARELLRDPERPIGDIALACGYSSQSHLSTCFKAEFGLAPARFRRQALSSR